ncbi:acyltransferase [Vibrio parahaemolyticus]|nr:acyltransferase [Vibrio parahaemolyticus]
MRLIKYIKIISKVSILKSIYYSIRFKGTILIGRKSKIIGSGKIKIINKGRLSIGLDYYSTKERSIIKISTDASIIINGNVSIKKGVLISLDERAELLIGNNTFVNEDSKIIIYSMCKIGSGCAISYNVNISDSDVHYINNSKNNCSPITIGDNVWIGQRSTIGKGVSIGDGAVIGACTFVNKNIETNSLHCGIPNRKIKSNVFWSH